MKTIKYSELKVGDVVLFHGAKEIIKKISIINYGEIIYFTLSPFDKKSIELLGNFYSNGTYGGNSDLEIELFERNE